MPAAASASGGGSLQPSPSFGPSAGSSPLLAPNSARWERTFLLDDFKLNVEEGEGESDEDGTAAGRTKLAPAFLSHSYQSTPGGSPIEPDDDESAATSSPPTLREKIFKAALLPCAIAISVVNSITWKRMLNRYASADGSNRNLEFFVNQWTLALYIVLCGIIMLWRMYGSKTITSVRDTHQGELNSQP